MILSFWTDRSGQTGIYYNSQTGLGKRVNPDQTAPEGSLIRVYTVCYSVRIFILAYPARISVNATGAKKCRLTRGCKMTCA